MIFDDLENIISLLAIIAGLLYCVSKYIDGPKRGYGYIIGFFLADFLGEYYWAIYVLTMRQDPEISEFVSYLGWDIAVVFLLLGVFFIRQNASKRFFSPLMLLPVLINIPQFLLYINFGGFLNNLWQVGITTATMVLCMQEIAYCIKNKTKDAPFPLFSTLVLVYLLLKYGMWTASCFDWGSHLADPYLYCTIASSIVSVSFAYGAGQFYEPYEAAKPERSAASQKFRVLTQAVVSLIILGLSAAGYFIAVYFKKSGIYKDSLRQNNDFVIVVLFAISAAIIFLVLIILYLLSSRFRHTVEHSRKMNEWSRTRLNFIFTIIVTLALMAVAVIYNNVILYNASVVSVNEDGQNMIRSTATEIENYMAVAKTTLKVAADTVDLMIKDGQSTEAIVRYITDQSDLYSENSTGIYAYINDEYLDGDGWIPPEGYDPTERDWYKCAVDGKGDVTIAKPYVDAQTGSIIVTIAKKLSLSPQSPQGSSNVICLDLAFDRIRETIEEVNITGKGYAMVVNGDGFIIASGDESFHGDNIKDYYGQDLIKRIRSLNNGRFQTRINGEQCTVFVRPVMEQWYTLIVVGNTELFEDTWSQLAISIMVSLITFGFISFFYYIGYKNEQIYGRKVEELNLQVVSALATAIDAKDNYTNGHSSRVAEYSRMIAARAGCSRKEQDEVYMMGLLHDVGKIGVPDEVINKPSKLSDEEFELIKKHPVIGSDILERIKERPQLATGARWHHERFGGGGYPDGIAGENIPEEARIIAVADAYDAMTSTRSYRDIMPQEKVRSEIEKGIGTQFDPRFAKVMLQMIDEDHSYSMREHIERPAMA